MSRVSRFRIGAVVVLPLLAGCGVRDIARVAQPAMPAKETPGVDAGLLAANDQPTADAPQPKEKPLGVVVSFPAVDGADKTSQNFAAGIGWFLTDAVGGAPELGQSPLRNTIYQVARERKITSLRMSQAEAVRVARVCGATHVAVGTLSESASEVRLSYQLHPVGDTRSAVASATLAVPNREALLRQLPKIAQELRAALGVPHSAVTAPPLAGVSPDLFLKLGACAETASYTPEQEAFLREAGKKVPLAAEMAVFIRSVRASTKEAEPYTRLLQKSVPVNTQTLGSLGYAVPYTLAADSRSVYTLSDRYPENYLFAHAAAWVARAARDKKQDALYSERGALNAPANPDARLSAAWSLADQASRLRQNRQYSDISPAVMVKITPMYAQWLTETKAATQCDPLYGKAYQRLANAATFAGDRAEAEAAMTMARKIYTDSPYDTYSWALEMYQPKWGGDPARLREVATEAASARYNSNNETMEIYQALGQLQFTDLQKSMADRLIQETEKTLAADPKNMYAHYLHGSLLMERTGRRKEAIADFVANAQNYPKDPAIQFDLGKQYTIRGNFPQAEGPLKKSLTLRPRDPETLYYMGYVLKQQQKAADAQKYLEAAVAITPDYADALTVLGTVNAMQQRIPAAIGYYERARRVRPFQPEANVNLAACYNSVGREFDTLRLGEEFLRYYPADARMTEMVKQAEDQLKRKKAPKP